MEISYVLKNIIYIKIFNMYLLHIYMRIDNGIMMMNYNFKKNDWNITGISPGDMMGNLFWGHLGV